MPPRPRRRRIPSFESSAGVALCAAREVRSRGGANRTHRACERLQQAQHRTSSSKPLLRVSATTLTTPSAMVHYARGGGRRRRWRHTTNAQCRFAGQRRSTTATTTPPPGLLLFGSGRKRPDTEQSASPESWISVETAVSCAVCECRACERPAVGRRYFHVALWTAHDNKNTPS